MRKSVVIIQRFYYNFREGFFDYLSDISFDFKLINATSPRGRVKVHDSAISKSFIVRSFHFFIGNNYVIFPFLFVNLFRINPEIIVTEGGQNTINNLQVLLFCKLFRRKYILWDLGKGYTDFGNSLIRKVYMRLYMLLANHALYIYGYNSMSKVYFQSLGIDSRKIIVLNNTIDTRKILKYSNDIVPNELKEQSAKGYIFFIFVGSLLRSKKIESMAELLKMLGENYYLIIVGEGTEQYKSELIDSFKGTNHVFVGYKKPEYLFPYYCIASFSILPGLGGLSINQSMAFGVPVICHSADGAEKDLVINNETGYIYKDLVDARNFIVSKTREDWKEMGIKSRAYLYENHSIESMMDKFVHYINISISNN